jgi:hypothetical protein
LDEKHTKQNKIEDINSWIDQTEGRRSELNDRLHYNTNMEIEREKEDEKSM